MCAECVKLTFLQGLTWHVSFILKSSLKELLQILSLLKISIIVQRLNKHLNRILLFVYNCNNIALSFCPKISYKVPMIAALLDGLM